MKIVHIAPISPYNDYWGYQENLLPKYQQKLGHEVTVIITNTTHREGNIVETGCADYILKDGVRIIRRPIKKYRSAILTNLRAKMDVYGLLCEIHPDFIFFHSLSSVTIYDAVKYKKKVEPNCVIVQDNHWDSNIARKAVSFRNKVVRHFYRNISRKSIAYIDCVYGVTPWRKAYAEDYFKIPSNKTDVLMMGADDEKIDFAHRNEIRNRIREEYHISDSDFLICTGGKIDKNKNIDLLMDACGKMKGVKLLIFGQVLDDVKTQFDSLLKNNKNIVFIGWVNADKVYDYFFASDLAFFPGQHSVLWEQACASKIPCVFERWEGTEHVNNGGNSDFLYPINEQTIREKISELFFTEKYYSMKKIAQSSATDAYLYSNIAKKSLEHCIMKDRTKE